MIGGLRCGNCRDAEKCTPEEKVQNGENCEKYIEDSSVLSQRNWT